MNRAFLINISLLIALNALVKPFYLFGIERTVQNLVGTTTYGMYFTLLTFTYLFQVVHDFGIQQYNSRTVSQQRTWIYRLLPHLLLVKLGLAFFFLGCIYIFGAWMGYLQDYPNLLAWIAFNQILVSFLFYLRTNISGLGYFRFDSLLSAADKLIMIGLCAYLIWGPPSRGFNIFWFVYAQTISLIFPILLAFWKLLHHTAFQWSKRIHWRLSWKLLRQSMPYALAIFLMTIYTRLDAVMIEKLHVDGLEEVGIYASAYRLLDALNMVGFLFAGLLLPMFSRMLQQDESVKSLLSLALGLMWSAALAIGIICYAFQWEIMDFLYVAATPYWGEVSGVLLFTFVAVGGMYIFSSLLLAAGIVRQMNGIYILGILTNIGLNFLLIPTHGALGAAIATLSTQSVILMAQIIMARWLVPVSLPASFWFRLLLFVGMVTVSTWMVDTWDLLDWKFAFFVLGGEAFALALVLRLIDWRGVRQLV